MGTSGTETILKGAGFLGVRVKSIPLCRGLHSGLDPAREASGVSVQYLGPLGVLRGQCWRVRASAGTCVPQDPPTVVPAWIWRQFLKAPVLFSSCHSPAGLSGPASPGRSRSGAVMSAHLPRLSGGPGSCLPFLVQPRKWPGGHLRPQPSPRVSLPTSMSSKDKNMETEAPVSRREVSPGCVSASSSPWGSILGLAVPRGSHRHQPVSFWAE